MKTTVIQKNFSMTKEDVMILEAVVSKSGLKAIDVIRELLWKADNDDVTIQKIVEQHKARKTLKVIDAEQLRIMSNVKRRKKVAPSDATAVSLNCQSKNNRLTDYEQDLITRFGGFDRICQIAKTPTGYND